MAPSVRKMSGNRVPSGGVQTTLSFNHRVTKPSVSKQSAKEVALSVTKPAKKTEKEEEEKKPKKEEDDDQQELKKIPVKKEEDEEAKVEDYKPYEPKEEDDEPEAEQKIAPVPKPEPTPKTEDETRAEKIGITQIRRYWRGIEEERMAKRLHQQGLDVGEKVLRYFDVSSQYGPCIGITRKKRWMRAQRLGLSPPIEVLAVLLMEENEDGTDIERASIDAILNPTVAV